MVDVNFLAELKSKVVTELVTKHNFDTDEAEEAVKEYAADSPDAWHENSDAVKIAEFLASEDDD